MSRDAEIIEDWMDWRGGAPMSNAMTFTSGGLLLGRGTVLAAFKKNEGGSKRNPIDGNEARIIALLTGTFGRPITGGVVEKMRRACAIWLDGDKGLAQIHLALTGLPQIGEWDAYCLHLAEKLLDRGLTPSELLKAIGFKEAARELEKYSDDQPRVPAGSGRASGQWTSGSGGGSGSGSGDVSHTEAERGKETSGNGRGSGSGRPTQAPIQVAENTQSPTCRMQCRIQFGRANNMLSP